MQNLQYLVPSVDNINNVVHQLLDNRVALILKASDLIECIDHVFNSLLLIGLAIMKVKLLEFFSKDIAKGAISINETFYKWLFRRYDDVPEYQVEIDHKGHPILIGVDQSKFMHERLLLQALLYEEKCLLCESHTVLSTIPCWT